MCASVVAHSDTAPVLEFPEHALDEVALLVERLIVLDGLLAVLLRSGARFNAVISQSLALS